MKFIRDIIAEKTQQSDKSKLDSRQDPFGQDEIRFEPQPEPELRLSDIMRAPMTPDEQGRQADDAEDEAEIAAEPDAAISAREFHDAGDQTGSADTTEYDGDFNVGVNSGSVFPNAEPVDESVSSNSPVDPIDAENDAADDGFACASDTFFASSSFQISASPREMVAQDADEDENLFAEPTDVAADDAAAAAQEVREHAVDALNENNPFEEQIAAPAEEQIAAPAPDAPFAPDPVPEPAPAKTEPQAAMTAPEPASPPVVQSMPPQPVDVPAPAVGRGAARAGRVKTRLLGFNAGNGVSADPFKKATQEASTSVTHFPVGWLVISRGPGRGAAFTLFNGVSQIGRGTDQTVCLDFGDNSISRESHAAIAYDAESQKFFLGHGGKTNLVRLNNRPVLSTEEMQSGNQIRVGETTLHFVALCGEEFRWDEDQQENFNNAACN